MCIRDSLYGDPIFGNEKHQHQHVASTLVSDELDDKWKKTITQLDMMFDVDSSTIFLVGEIVEGTMYDVIAKVRAILKLRSEASKDSPINLVINSVGGDVYEVLGLIDYINSMTVKVNTICRGKAFSAAALLLACGTGKRYVSKNSSIMVHEISTEVFGKSSDIKVQNKHLATLDAAMLDLLTSHSTQDKEFWRTATEKDFYMTVDTALELSLIHI